MIVTLAAAQSFIAHVAPGATLSEAHDAIRGSITCERTVAAAVGQQWCTVKTRIGRVVFQGAYVTAVWPLGTIVSRGPIARVA